MEITKVNKDNLLIIRIKGDLDASSAIHMDNEIRTAYENEVYNVLIDCCDLNYISSAGVGVFVSYFEDFKSKNGKLVFFNMKHNVHNVFNILGLGEILKIVNTEEEALGEVK